MCADTIAAIATAPGLAGVAIVRVSGPDAFALAERLTGRKPTAGRIELATVRAVSVDAASRRVNERGLEEKAKVEGEQRREVEKKGGGGQWREVKVRGEGEQRWFDSERRGETRPSAVSLRSAVRLQWPETSNLEPGTSNLEPGTSNPEPRTSNLEPRTRNSEPRTSSLDSCVVLAFAGPRSYTGEDVVEFQCHGGAVTPRRILEACFAAGARLARRGEFTERAFLNGKLDYDQAESVLDLIHARTDRAADAALEGLAGRRKRELRRLYDAALAVSAEYEHSLDVDESDLPESFFASLGEKVATLLADLRGEIARIRRGRIMRDGALVVLAGPPNAGKSSLLNALLGENRAIVSDVPGTTRDSIDAWLDLEGYPVRLVDTAGLREVPPCRRGVSPRQSARVEEEVEKKGGGGQLREVEKKGGGGQWWADFDLIEAEGIRRSFELISRADVVLCLDCEIVAAAALRLHSKCDLGRGVGLNVSAKTGEGLAELKAELVRRIAALEPKADDSNLDALLEAERQLAAGSTECDPVLAANAVRSATQSLGSALGATYSEDLLDRLFSRFCVGK